MSIKFRTLLSGFGYYRRTEAIITEVQGQLQASGMSSDFSVTCQESRRPRDDNSAGGHIASSGDGESASAAFRCGHS